ncbi:hypothetical protein NE237_002348 [Protea cynaroides]|uniref:Uncharacterized protein n=1 Tax=Protea cynaroides TaxID=273540 RepID=A0A9Q0KUS8_9MAGN|nr:hypothetical protein NE237_002348 [Protea cynaroides]
MESSTDGNSNFIINEDEIRRTHTPDGKKVDIRLLHKLINKTLMPSATRIVERDHRVVDANPFIKIYMELKDFMGDLVNVMDTHFYYYCLLPVIINGIGFSYAFAVLIFITLSCKCSKGGDVNSATVALFQTLSNYSWEVKMVLAFAAFAVVYGESSLMVDQTEPLAESVKLLKQSPNKSKLWKIQNLIHALVKVTNTIVEIGDSQSAGNIETVVSWTVGTIVVCMSHITGSVGLDDGDTKDVDLFELTKKVDEMNMQLARGDGMKPSRDLIFDVNAIRSTHVYDGKIEIVELNILHKFINEILVYSTSSTSSTVQEDPRYRLADILLLLCKCSRGGDENSKTVALFKMLSHYSWEAKMILTLASFAVIYGESSLMAKKTNSLADSIKLLKQSRGKSKLFKIQSLINVIVKVNERIAQVEVEVKDWQNENISTHIETTISWIVGSVIVCTSHVIGLDDEYTDDELLKLRNKIDGMNTQLGQELDTWRQSFVDKKIADAAAAEVERIANEAAEAQKRADEVAAAEHIKEVADKLRVEGLKSSNLIIGIDFSGSNGDNGPTCYAPIIEAAIDIVEKVVDNTMFWLSLLMIGGYPLSIVYVGVGDAPWDKMDGFGAEIDGRRKFDNFQFVPFYDIMKRNENLPEKVKEFSRVSTEKIAMQYKASEKQGFLGWENYLFSNC